MHRQSLGSPVSKLHQSNGGARLDDTLFILDDNRRKDILAFSTSSSHLDDDNKAIKPHRLSSPPPPLLTTPDKVIHFIPILTVLCFLILFLFSHTPSQSDLAQFNGFTRLPGANRVDSVEDKIGGGRGDIRRFIDIRKSDVLQIRSLRDLGGETRRPTPRSRSHRKIADF